jgi:hypothetical protein
MKNIQISILFMFLVTLYQCQKKETDIKETRKHYQKNIQKDDSVLLNISTNISSNNIKSINLYKYNQLNICDQSKAVSIIYNQKLSHCFDYVKTIEGKEVVDFIKIIKNPTTYGAEDVACFDTDYSVTLLNKENQIAGYLNISFSCNKLISNPVIKERKFHSRDGLTKVGFSKKGRRKIKNILKL